MASRYAVGLPWNWDATAGTKWATTSGGAGGAAVPTSADDVFFDSSSGSGEATISGSAPSVKSLTCVAGFTGTISGALGFDINVYGNVSLCSGMTWAGYATGNFGSGFTFQASGTFSQNGATMTNSRLDVLSGATCTLGSDLTIAKLVNIAAGGTLDCASYTFTSSTAVASNVTLDGTLLLGSGTAKFSKLDSVGASSAINFGSGTLELTGTGTTTINAGCTITAGTGTLKVTNSSSSSKTLALAGKTYNNLWLAHGSTGTVTISGSNTFNDYKITSTTGAVLHTAGTTQTVSSIDWNGTAGNLVTVRSTSNGSAWNISKSGGTVTVNNCSIRDSAAAGGATFIADNSTDVSGNSGWIFRIVGFLGFGRLLPF